MENDQEYIYKLSEVRKEFFEAMDNDFNTPSAFSTIFDIIREVNRDINDSNISKNALTKLKALIIEFGFVLGFDFSLKNENEAELQEDLIELLKDVRSKLREKKEWDLSDEIRSKLKELDIVLEDKST